MVGWPICLSLCLGRRCTAPSGLCFRPRSSQCPNPPFMRYWPLSVTLLDYPGRGRFFPVSISGSGARTRPKCLSFFLPPSLSRTTEIARSDRPGENIQPHFCFTGRVRVPMLPCLAGWFLSPPTAPFFHEPAPSLSRTVQISPGLPPPQSCGFVGRARKYPRSLGPRD